MAAFAITGARVIPVEGAPFSDGVVLVEDGTIRALGTGARVPEGSSGWTPAARWCCPGWSTRTCTWACTRRARAGPGLVIDHGTEAALLADRIAERGVPVLIGPL